jgi:uncharacterized protein YndB with AHSA1/START domain
MILDKVEKKIILHAPVTRVWAAITDAAQFSDWFGISLKGDFAVGKTMTGTFEKGFNEDEIIEYQKKLGLKPSKIRKLEANFVFCTVEQIAPEKYFSFRWIPYGIDAEMDPKNEPTTLVEFHLEKVSEGTQLTIIESGFNRVPPHRRERAFRMNEGGWAEQSENIRKYVER